MLNQFSRTQLIVGQEAIEKLRGSSVAIFGIGGVGGYATEALCRSGIGKLHLIDDDLVCLTNLNRQIHATYHTIGHFKVDVAAERIREINPKAEVYTYKTFCSRDNMDAFPFAQFDYVIDAIDTVTGKLAIIQAAMAADIPVISAMGTGNKMNPSMLEVADIYETSVCPLARVMRRELRKRGVPALKVVYSKEKPIPPLEDMSISCRTNCVCPPGTKRKCTDRRQIPGSNAFVPATAGLLIASEVVKDLISGVPRECEWRAKESNVTQKCG